MRRFLEEMEKELREDMGILWGEGGFCVEMRVP